MSIFYETRIMKCLEMEVHIHRGTKRASFRGDRPSSVLIVRARDFLRTYDYYPSTIHHYKPCACQPSKNGATRQKNLRSLL